MNKDRLTGAIALLALIYCIVTSFFKMSPTLNVAYGIRVWGELVYNIAISVVAAFIFFFFQNIILENKRKKTINPIVLRRIEYIINSMDGAIFELGNRYLENHTGNEYSKEELHAMLKLNFDDDTSYTNACLLPELKKIKMRDWLIDCADKVEEEINRLFSNCGNDLPEEITNVLEDILHSEYHRLIIKYAKWRIPMGSFEHCNDEIIADYWLLRNKIMTAKAVL